MHRIVTAGALVLILAVPEIRAQSQTRHLSPDIEELLWWLPPDTETLQVERAPDKPRGLLFDVKEDAHGEVDDDAAPWVKVFARHLNAAKVAVSVDGSRHFAPPRGFGDMPFEGAEITRFARPLGETGQHLMAELGKLALKADRFDGVEILEFRDKAEDDVWTSLVTMPRDDVLVVATSRAYLEELLSRRKARTGTRALPEDLPEWQWADVTAPFWALRHFRRDAPNDTTSPFKESNVVDGFDPAAVGVTASVRPDGRTFVVHYLSSAANAEQIARRVWHHPDEGVSPAFRPLGANVLQIRFVAKDESDLSMFLMTLLGVLGHATYM